jgi:hypothetical protein
LRKCGNPEKQRSGQTDSGGVDRQLEAGTQALDAPCSLLGDAVVDASMEI